jgi:hypothetical protein
MKPVIYIRSGWLTAAILFAAGCSSGGNGGGMATNVPLAQRPTLSPIANQMVAQDSVSAPISFTVGDSDSDPATLKVTARAADSTLIAQDRLTLGGNGANRTITIAPNDSAFGNTTVAVVVTDATGAQVTGQFTVQVTTMAVSFLNFAQQTVGADENSAPRSLAGLSFTQDADDPGVFSSNLMN